MCAHDLSTAHILQIQQPAALIQTRRATTSKYFFILSSLSLCRDPQVAIHHLRLKPSMRLPTMNLYSPQSTVWQKFVASLATTAMYVCAHARTHVQEDVDKFIDGRSKILLGDEPPGSSSDDGEDEKTL